MSLFFNYVPSHAGIWEVEVQLQAFLISGLDLRGVILGQYERNLTSPHNFNVDHRGQFSLKYIQYGIFIDKTQGRQTAEGRTVPCVRLFC